MTKIALTAKSSSARIAESAFAYQSEPIAREGTILGCA